MAKLSSTKAAKLGNDLLIRLAGTDLKALKGGLESVALTARQTVSQFDDRIEHIYFPVTAVLALHIGGTSSPGGPGIELAMVGKEGMAGYTALLGVPTSLHHVVCLRTGECLRTPTATFVDAMLRRPEIDALVRRYMAVAFFSLAQAVLCHASHAVEQRFCRWLLVAQDKGPGEVPATQELLAAILGVKRPTISLVAHSLQKQGVISYHRGTVRIIDAEKLEQFACSCFRAMKRQHDQILGT